MIEHELPADQFDAAADALGDSPFTVIPTHLLRQRWCRAYIVGDLLRFDALLIHHKNNPSEPVVFGSNAQAIGQLLRELTGWWCIEAATDVAPVLAEIMQRGMAVPMRLYADVHHTLTQPAPDIQHSNVRLLTTEDITFVSSSQSDRPREEIEWIVRNGVMAGAIVDERLIAIAQTYALSANYCDVGVWTHEAFRKQGYATACASLVAREVQHRGLTPVWSTGEDNYASLRVAAKLGFREMGRMTYVIPVRQTSV